MTIHNAPFSFRVCESLSLSFAYGLLPCASCLFSEYVFHESGFRTIAFETKIAYLLVVVVVVATFFFSRKHCKMENTLFFVHGCVCVCFIFVSKCAYNLIMGIISYDLYFIQYTYVKRWVWKMNQNLELLASHSIVFILCLGNIWTSNNTIKIFLSFCFTFELRETERETW